MPLKNEEFGPVSLVLIACYVLVFVVLLGPLSLTKIGFYSNNAHSLFANRVVLYTLFHLSVTKLKINTTIPFPFIADTKNSVGLVGCIEEVAHNAIAIYWNPMESPAKV